MSLLAAGHAPRVHEPVASARHTLVLIGIFACLTAAGALRQVAATASSRPEAASAHPMLIYLPLLVGEWALVYYVWRGGVSGRRISIADLVGGRWTSARDVLRDVALGAGLWAAWHGVAFAWDRVVGAGHAATVEAFLPRHIVEQFVWVLLSLSAGFCEELVFRGYLLRQFEAWTHRRWLALLLQAALFGISHGYQGAMACVKIALFGVGFGLLALWRGSLRPGMIAHALTDMLAGLFRV